MPLLTLLNPRLIGVVLGVVLVVSFVFGVYRKGVTDERGKWEILQSQALLKATEESMRIEQEHAVAVQKVIDEYNTRIKKSDDYWAAWANGARLRVKERRNNGVPKTGGTSQGTDVGTTDDKRSTGLDRERVVEALRETGRRNDVCRDQVKGLQDFIRAER